MESKIIFATHNVHKAGEVSAIIDNSSIHIQTLADINYHEEIIEDGIDLNENAWIKANHIHQLFGTNVMADDTGLEVFSLGGAPGVLSARYAGSNRDADENMNKLLEALTTQEKEGIDDRSAQFRTVIALWLEGEQHTFEGIIKGTIARAKTGNEGFGYDPIFIPEGYEESFGVLPASIKNECSHRARAFMQVKQFLLQPS